MTQIATDNFNRADAGNLGADWSSVRGALAIDSNAATGSDSIDIIQRWIGAGSALDRLLPISMPYAR